MDKKQPYQHQHRCNNGNGFLLGVIVGALLILLLTTKRGRAVLKDMMERGAEKFSQLEDLLRASEDNDFIPSEPVDAQLLADQKIEKKEKSEKQEESEKPVQHKSEAVDEKEHKKEKVLEEKETKSSSNKRWFHGLKKKT
jgi:hypothetical protein